MSSWISIDFGTCNTSAAIEVDGKPHIVTVGNAHNFPSVACVMPDGNIQVCQNAEPLRTKFPENFLQEFKLQMAEPLGLNGKEYVDVVCEILKYVKGYAEIENNGKKVDSVVLTIPALYSAGDRRLDVMRQAAANAGFQHVEFLSEANAAANHYSDILGAKNTGISLIYDLGGGTFDPTLIDLSDHKNPVILGNEVGVKCGGQFFDTALYQHICQLVADTAPLDCSKKMEDYQACKRLKETLSIAETASQYFSNGQSITVKRENFNNLIKDYIQKTLEACDAMLHTAQISWTDVKQILFVGGSTAIPLITQMLENHLESHNATSVRIIRNLEGKNGPYNYLYATCMGALAPKIAPPPPPPEPIAKIIVGDTALQLKSGLNTFGRSPEMNFSFPDDYMSRHHFSIMVTKDSSNKWSYNLTTCSKTHPTVVGMEALDVDSPFARKSIMLQDGVRIYAGKTTFIFKK